MNNVPAICSELYKRGGGRNIIFEGMIGELFLFLRAI
jgi:hypothetical protein